MTTILLIRHGVNDAVGKYLAGRTPGVHLNDEGREQTRRLAELFEGFPIKAIYASPLERTLETAGPVASAVGVEVRVHHGLIEADYGECCGKAFEELHKLEFWGRLKDEPASVRFPQGESIPEIQARAVAAVEEIVAKHGKDDLVLCFTHGDIIRLATAHFIHLPLNEYQHLVTTPAAITELRFYEGGALLVRYNQSITLDAAHYCNEDAVKAG